MEIKQSDYSGNVAGSARDARELDRIEMAADRLSVVRDRLTGFLARYNGVPQGVESHPTPVPSGYRGQMDRLFDTLGELENMTSDLTSLG